MRMAEPESTTSTIKPEKKTLPLDDEIGKDFLGSWNLLSVTKDDTMDFNFETVSKGIWISVLMLDLTRYHP